MYFDLISFKKTRSNTDSIRKTNDFENNMLKVEHIKEKIKIWIFLEQRTK